MVRAISLFCALLLVARISSLPNARPEEKETAVDCSDTEVGATNADCAKALNVPQITADAPKKKKSTKRRKLQKKLAQEMRDIKKMVLSGLEKENITVPAENCPHGQEFNEFGDCVPVPKLVVNGTETIDAKKTSKSQRLQKKLERELEKALKKEIQNELRKKRRNKKKTATAGPGVNNAGTKPLKPSTETTRTEEVSTNNPAEL